MKDINEIERRLGLIALCIGLGAAFLLLPLKNNAIALGLCLGAGVSILNFGLFADEAVKKSRRLLKYAFISMALIAAAEKGEFYLLGTALGLFTMKTAVFADNLLISK